MVYRVEWRREPHDASAAGAPAEVIILADDSGVGTALARLVQERGGRAVVLIAGTRLAEIAPLTWEVDPLNRDHFTDGVQAAVSAGTTGLTIV